MDLLKWGWIQSLKVKTIWNSGSQILIFRSARAVEDVALGRGPGEGVSHGRTGGSARGGQWETQGWGYPHSCMVYKGRSH